ncbi:MAG TPA: MFS transporter [Rhizomicrobium sp.]|jgi:predicted MFS family arabinose efflux permease|nr:MFS transporter [Rhizomicrobium sp.]
MVTASAGPRATRMGLVLAASAAGTVFEWYDFFIFGSLLSIITKHFFAGAGETQGYILALLTFAVGFAVRPFGGLVFGYFGDRTGRKRAFLVTITMMGVATFAIGLLPDTSVLGNAAPYLLVGLRVLQGFAVGGEYGGAAIYVAEHSAPDKRGAATGWIQVAATIGLFLALTIILSVRTSMGEDAFGEWGWRIPFLISLGLLVISIWIRLKLDESPAFRQLQLEGQTSRAPLSEAFLRWKNLRIVLVVLAGLLMGQGVVWYTAQFYTQFFLERVVKVEPRMVNLLILSVTVLSGLLHIFFARLSDRVGRKPVMLFGLGLAALTLIPGFQWLTEAVNPALVEATARAPVTVFAAPSECSLQFDLIGKAKFSTSCDIAKSSLTNLGVPYRNVSVSAGTLARIRIGTVSLSGIDGTALAPSALAAAQKNFTAEVRRALSAAHYPTAADTGRIDIPLALAILLVFVTAAAALYGPQAATLVELFPTRIRYSALSLPYHVGVGWFGGFLPPLAFAIVAATGNLYAGLWYPVTIAGIGFVVTLLFLPETRWRELK